jgi:hypothetical protein
LVDVTELYNRDLQFWDLTLTRLSFDMSVYIRVLRHQRTLIFLNLCLLTFFAADPSSTRDIVPLWFSILLWPIAFGAYLIFYNFLLLGVSALSGKVSKLRVPLPLLGGISLLPTVYLCQAAVKWASGGLYQEDILSQLIFFFLAVQALETVFFKFIMPSVREQLTNEEPERHLIVGGERFNMRGLLHIEAREHHVHLTFENGRKLFRARLGDIVAQTRAEDGFQPHRSWWVARDSVIIPRRKGGRLFLRLRDDTEVPVARTRIEDVQQWLETHIGGLQ